MKRFFSHDVSVLVKMSLHWVPVYPPIQSISQHLREACQGELTIASWQSTGIPFRHQHEPTCDTSSRRFTRVIFNALFRSPFADGPWAKAANVAKTTRNDKGQKLPWEFPLRCLRQVGGKEITVMQCHVQWKPLELPMATDANTHTSTINIHYDS